MKPGAEPDGFEAFERALLGLLACGVALALAVDAIGGLAALLSGGGWAGVPLAEMPSVLERLPSTLADPRRAWPHDVRHTLPGPAGFAAAVTLVLAFVSAGIAGGLRWRKRRHGDTSRPARWGRRRDLRKLLVGSAAGRRVVLGRVGRSLVAAEPGHVRP